VQSRGRVDRDADGRALRLLGVTVDITELKEAEHSLRLLAEAGEALGSSLDYQATLDRLTRTVVPRMADWCVLDLLDDRGDLDRVAVNHADPAKIAVARELFAKYPPQRSAGSGLWRVIDGGGADWRAEIGDDALAAVAVDAEHLRLLRALRLRSYLCVPLQVRGRVIGALTLVFAESGRQYREADVTLAKDIARRAATAVENARLFERLRTEDRRKDEFLATLAHELRNPLAPIRNGLDIIKRKGNGPETARTRDVMERQLSHLIRLVDDLLDVSRVTQGKVNLHREQVDLQTVVGTALEAVRSAVDAAGLALEVRLPPTPLVLEADRTRIAQVLCNLLNNAAKYTEPGGQVVVAGALVGEEVEISVADTGIGIPPELLGQVFEMFAQVGSSLERSQGGLGIGLTLVRRLVDLHGGRVWAESDGPGRGSRFVVRLPRAAPGPETAPGVAALAPARSGQLGRRVLVVDDNDDAAETLAEILRFDGHEVTTAASGPAALSAVVRFRPDVALLDIGMPGMSGYELARRLRADPRLSSTVLVALTGWGQDKDRRESQEAGFAQHLTKPVDLDRLRQIVEAAERLRD
jgi:signal transduction histidine kinase